MSADTHAVLSVGASKKYYIYIYTVYIISTFSEIPQMLLSIRQNKVLDSVTLLGKNQTTPCYNTLLSL